APRWGVRGRAGGLGSPGQPSRGGACRPPPVRPRRSVSALRVRDRPRHPRRCRQWTANVRPCRLPAPWSSVDPAMRVLILGGTTEASALAQLLAGDGRFEAVLSLAGRTSTPRP